MAISFIDSFKKLVNNTGHSNDILNDTIIIDNADMIANLEETLEKDYGLDKRNLYRAKHVFGSFENIDEALQNGTVDQYDTLFLRDADGRSYVGWIDENGDKVFIDLSGYETVENVQNKLEEVKSYMGEVLDGCATKEYVDDIVARIDVEETDPTVPAWAKAPEKPSYTAKEVGARPITWTPSASDIGAEPTGTAENKVSEHNTSIAAHNDIRLLIEGLATRLNVLANSDDTTLDQMAEVVTYIKSNRTLIESVTTYKVNISDIIDNLTTNVTNKPLSAAQGVALKDMIDVVQTLVDNIKVPTKTSELINDSNYLTSVPDEYVTNTELDNKGLASHDDINNLSQEISDHKKDAISHVTSAEKQIWNNKSNFSGDYNDLKNKPTIPEGADLTGYATENFVKEYSQPRGNYLTEHQDLSSYAKKTDIPSVPTKTSQLTNDSGFLTHHQDLSEYAKKSEIPKDAEDVNADPSGTAADKVGAHNTNTSAHNDIRLLIEGLTVHLNTLANSDDTTLDQMAEVVAYIKSNRTLIEGVTTNKVNVTDIIDNLTTNVSNKPLSAKQGVELKALINALQQAVNGIKVPEKVSELENDAGYLKEHQSLSGYAKTTDLPTKTSELLNDSGYVAENDIGGTIEITSGDPTKDKTVLTLDPNGGEVNIYTAQEIDLMMSQLSGGETVIPDNYVTEEKLAAKGYLTSVPGEYITETELNAKKYLTAVPSEYVTDTELNAKGYAKQSDVDKIADYSNVSYGTCSTDAATAEKVVTVDNENWELKVGAIVMVKFTTTNSASNVKLNVNETGAYPIWYNNAEYTSTGTAYTGYANRVIGYMFDGTYWIWIMQSYDANTTYKNVSLGHGYATCSTAEATTAKVGTLSSYALTVGGIVAVKFTYAVPANATLNINSKGAKNIFYRGAKIVANVIKAGDIVTFIYDGTQYQLLSIDRWQSDIDNKQPKGNYLTSIPSEYITETELEAKGYATQTVVNALSEEIANYLPKNQGAGNVGKILVVGTDGNLVLTDMPESGASGDVVGVVDENNNILLSGNLADGTYTFKYETEEGEFVEVGTLEVGANYPSEPSGDNNILTSGDYDIKLNTRWSNSAGGFTGHSGMIAFTVPLEDVWGKTIRFKGFTPNITATSNSAPLWMTVDSNNSKVDLLAGTSDATGNIWKSSFLHANDGGEYNIVVNNSTFPTSGNGSAVKLAINMAVSATGSVTTLDGLSMTIEETNGEVEPEVVNLIPTLTDIDLSTIYNGVGYKEDTRISVSSVTTSNPTGEKTQTGTTLLGLMPLGDDGDVLHLRGAKFYDATQGAGDYDGIIWCYDANGKLLNTGTLSLTTSNLQGTDANGDYTFKMTHSKMNLISGTAYVRFNICNPTGELFMTRNQLIPV